MQLANVMPHVPCYFVRHPAVLLPLQCCLWCTLQHEVPELDGGGLALHMHLTGKSVMMPSLPHSWSSHCISVAALHVLIIAKQLLQTCEELCP